MKDTMRAMFEHRYGKVFPMLKRYDGSYVSEKTEEAFRGYLDSQRRLSDLIFAESPTTTTAQAEEAPPQCRCTLAQRMVGDGCHVCNPELAAEIERENAEHPASEGDAEGGV